MVCAEQLFLWRMSQVESAVGVILVGAHVTVHRTLLIFRWVTSIVMETPLALIDRRKNSIYMDVIPEPIPRDYDLGVLDQKESLSEWLPAEQYIPGGFDQHF